MGEPSASASILKDTRGRTLESCSTSVKCGRAFSCHSSSRDEHMCVSIVEKPSLATHPSENTEGRTVGRSKEWSRAFWYSVSLRAFGSQSSLCEQVWENLPLPSLLPNTPEDAQQRETYRCQPCGKAFTSQSSLQEHIRMHSREA